MEAVSPALAGGFFTTKPPGKHPPPRPHAVVFLNQIVSKRLSVVFHLFSFSHMNCYENLESIIDHSIAPEAMGIGHLVTGKRFEPLTLYRP